MQHYTDAGEQLSHQLSTVFWLKIDQLLGFQLQIKFRLAQAGYYSLVCIMSHTSP